MALDFRKLFVSKQVASAAPDVIFSTQSLPTATILRNGRVRFLNVTLVAVTVKAWVVPAAGSVANNNLCLPETALAGGAFLDFDLPTMGAGESFVAQSGVNLSVTIQPMDGVFQS
jgi:hypothetical protein